MAVKDIILLLGIGKLRNGTKTFLEPSFFLFKVKFKKLGFLPLKLVTITYSKQVLQARKSIFFVGWFRT